MASDDEDSETVGDGEFDNEYEENEIDEDILDAIEAGVEEASEGESEPNDDYNDSDDSSDEDDDEDDDEPSLNALSEALPPAAATSAVTTNRATSPPPPPPPRRSPPTAPAEPPIPPREPTPPSRSPSHRKRSPSPAARRRANLRTSIFFPKSYQVEAIAALPHPVPTHALAASPCMLHLLTGSEDGYIRDYDIFSALNGKVFLSAPQRHHAGVVEGIMKAGQIRSWWENPAGPVDNGDFELSPVHSLAMHSDALWGLSGTNAGHVNLFTIRHEPGRLITSLSGHRGPVSALSLQHDEKGFFSAGWDGDAVQWDLNTGQIVRRLTAHGAQLAAIAIRPLASDYPHLTQGPMVNFTTNTSQTGPEKSKSSQAHSTQAKVPDSLVTDNSSSLEGGSSSTSQQMHQQASAPDADAKSDASFDPLFDDEPDADGEPDAAPAAPAEMKHESISLAMPTSGSGSGSGPALHLPSTGPPVQSLQRPAPMPKNAPPLLDRVSCAAFSPDILMTAAMDGQVVLWDLRVSVPSPGRGVGRLWMSEKTPPWCLSACWSVNGAQLYAGRRNGTIDVWDVRQLGTSGPAEVPRLLKTLKNPSSSGVVSCVAAFPDGRHIACASNDNIRLWNAAEAGEGETKGRVQFKIIPGHHGGIVSQMVIDPGARFLVSASGNRGWHGDATRTVFVHDIKTIV